MIFTCDICQTYFIKRKSTSCSDGKQRCKKCQKIRASKRATQWNKQHRERALANHKRYQSSKKGQQTKKIYYTLNRAHHCKTMRENYQKNKEVYKARARAYEKTENGKRLNREKRKRRYWRDPEYARLKATAARHGIENTMLQKLFKKQSSCQLCKSKENLSVDHMQPIKFGGTSNLENLQILCVPCNSFKGCNLFLPEGGMMVMRNAY